MSNDSSDRAREIAETGLLAELARVKVIFQMRALAAVMGVPPPPLPAALRARSQSHGE